MNFLIILIFCVKLCYGDVFFYGGERVKSLEGFFFDRTVGRRCSQSTEHYHKGYEIYCMTEGECGYFIDDSIYEVRAGSIIFIPPGLIHRTIYTDMPHSRLLINFTDRYIPECLGATVGGMKKLYCGEELFSKVVSLMEEIEREWQGEDIYSMEMLEGLTYRIMILLARDGVSEPPEEHSLAIDAVRYIRERYAEDVRLSMVAELLSVSPEHLSRVFRQKTGFGFNEYLSLVRLQRAEQLLEEEPKMSISEIAYACGFNDSNYFSHRFKQAYGHSPKMQRGRGQRVEEAGTDSKGAHIVRRKEGIKKGNSREDYGNECE